MKCLVYYESSLPVDNMVLPGKPLPTQLLVVLTSRMYDHYLY